MNLLLITKTKMIMKIFDLICSKLDITFSVQNNTEVEKRFDFIIVDQDFIDNRFNIVKQHCKKIGAITNEELPFDKSRDFLIPRPFLPHNLQTIIQEQIEFIKEEQREQNKQSHKKVDTFVDEELDDADDLTAYIENLADDVAHDIEDESDESIVSLAALKNGGVLDRSELGKITNILKEESIENNFLKSFQDEEELTETDWKDLSEIIDEALIEVSDYEFDMNYNEPYNLVLNNYSVEELRPLLKKLNQKLIDKLSHGETIDLKLSLKV